MEGIIQTITTLEMTGVGGTGLPERDAGLIGR